MTIILYIVALIKGAVWIRIGSAEVVINCSYPFSNGKVQMVNASTLYTKNIVSPNYPLPYDNSYTSCIWVIVAPDPGYVIKVVFNDLQLEDDEYLNKHYRCRHVASLVFSNGHHSWGAKLGSYCGSVPPEVFYSPSHLLHVEFLDNQNKKANRGFSFSFLAVKKEEAPAICRDRRIGPEISSMHGSSGTFFSPDFPMPYLYLEECKWTISVPAFKRVKLTFETFDLSRTHISCPREIDMNDYVEIRDGPTEKNYEIAAFCEYNTLNLPPPVYSTGRNLFVIFRSYGQKRRDRKRGFKAHFEAVDQPADINSTEVCFPGNLNNENLRLTGEKGTLKSPLDLYPPSLKCNWTITVREGKIVELTFIDKFEMGPGDYVIVLDGSLLSDKRINDPHLIYTDYKPLHSSGRYMTVQFRSGSEDYYRYPGFKAIFKAVTVDDGSRDLTSVLAISLTVGLLVVIVFSIVCIVKRKKSSNRETGDDRIPMTTSVTTPHSQLSHQPTDRPNSTPAVHYAPVPTNPPPPPYPGVEVPQYPPPPGESYPWLQNNDLTIT